MFITMNGVASVYVMSLALDSTYLNLETVWTPLNSSSAFTGANHYTARPCVNDVCLTESLSLAHAHAHTHTRTHAHVHDRHYIGPLGQSVPVDADAGRAALRGDRG